MKTISIEECGTCGSVVHSSTSSITIMPKEELAFAIRKTKCDSCRLEEERTAGKKARSARKLNYDDF